MTVLCVESTIVYADGVSAVNAEGGTNKTLRVSGTNSFAVSATSAQYNLGLIIIAESGEETQDDGDINVGAKMSGTFSGSVDGLEIRNLRTNILGLTGSPNATL